MYDYGHIIHSKKRMRRETPTIATSSDLLKGESTNMDRYTVQVQPYTVDIIKP